jgi:hypothetical protein
MNQSGSLITFTREFTARTLVFAGTIISAVARAKETKSDDPPHFSDSAI